MKCVMAAVVVTTVFAVIPPDANAQQALDVASESGPPAWVITAWETSESPVVPESGPPAWVVEAWQNGERPQRPAGPPPWIASRHAIARQLGLPGPPPEVIDAWQNGDGADLPGPPEFVFEWFGF